MIKILNNLRILQSKKCVGLSLFKTGEDTFDMDFVELTKTKSTIHITKKEYASENLNKIIERLPKGLPMILSLDGKGILHKTGNSVHKVDAELVNSVFPNIKLSDFYYQKQEIGSKKFHVSIVRQSIVDDILKKVSEAGIFTIGFSLGPVSINHILPVTKGPIPIQLKNYQLEVVGEMIDSIQKTDEGIGLSQQSYMIDSEQIESNFLLPFSMAFSYFINTYNDSMQMIALIKQLQEEFTFRHLFKLAGIFILSFLLAILLINFVFFSHYNDKFNKLSTQYTLQKENISRLDTLIKKLESKEKIIKDKKMFLRSRFSFYCDRIAQFLPDEVQLNELEIQPLKATIEDNKLIEFEQSKMYIRGISGSTIVLGEWISKLKQEPWIEKVIMQDYASDNTRKKANFNIVIDIRNEQ